MVCAISCTLMKADNTFIIYMCAINCGTRVFCQRAVKIIITITKQYQLYPTYSNSNTRISYILKMKTCK